MHRFERTRILRPKPADATLSHGCLAFGTLINYASSCTANYNTWQNLSTAAKTSREAKLIVCLLNIYYALRFDAYPLNGTPCCH